MRGLSYASGNFGKALIVGALELTALFYLTDMVGAPPGVAGTALFMVQLTAAALDPLVGRAVDRLAFSGYRAGPFIATGALLSALSFALLYSLPLWRIRHFELAIALMLSIRVGISLMEVPYNALLPRVSRINHARTSIAIWKLGFSTLAVLMLSLVIDLVIVRGDPSAARWQLLLFGLFCGCLGAASVMLAWWRVRHCDRRTISDGGQPAPSMMPRGSAFAAMWHREYVLLFLVLILTPFTTQLFIKSLAHWSLYVMDDPAAARNLLIALMAGQFPGLLLWNGLVRTVSTARATAMAFALMAAGFAMLSALSAMSLILMATLVIGLGAAGALSMVWSLAADCADRVSIRSGLDQGSTIFGLLAFGGKFGSALATLGLGWGLSLARMEPGQPASAFGMDMIRLLNSGVPALVAGACFLALMTYDRKAAHVPPRST